MLKAFTKSLKIKNKQIALGVMHNLASFQMLFFLIYAAKFKHLRIEENELLYPVQ